MRLIYALAGVMLCTSVFLLIGCVLDPGEPDSEALRLGGAFLAWLQAVAATFLLTVK